MFEKHPVSERGYPPNGFWRGYEHHASAGLTSLSESSRYLQDQQGHHDITVMGQQRIWFSLVHRAWIRQRHGVCRGSGMGLGG